MFYRTQYTTGTSHTLSVLPKIGTAREIFAPVKTPSSLNSNTFQMLQDIMEERIRREESILSSSPHKTVVNAIKYAKAMNIVLDMGLEKKLNLLFCKFEQEYRRIVDVQNDILSEYPGIYQSTQICLTRKRFRRHLNDTLELRQRQEELQRTKTYLSLPAEGRSLSRTNVRGNKPSTRGMTSHPLLLSPWKHDSSIVYLPPI